MRKLLVTLLVLLVLAVAADRIAASVTSGVLASRLKSSGDLQSDPSVTVTGFPFLTQALAGRYDDIEVRVGPEQRGGVRLTSLDVDVRGARVPLSDAVRGDVTSVPVERLDATALVAYADLASAGDVAGLVITPVGGGVRVTGSVRVLGQTVRASATSAVRLVGSTIEVRARSIAVQGQSSPAVDRALAGLLDLRVPVGRLPYGLELTGLTVGSDGVRLAARTGVTVLTAR